MTRGSTVPVWLLHCPREKALFEGSRHALFDMLVVVWVPCTELYTQWCHAKRSGPLPPLITADLTVYTYYTQSVQSDCLPGRTLYDISLIIKTSKQSYKVFFDAAGKIPLLLR